MTDGDTRGPRIAFWVGWWAQVVLLALIGVLAHLAGIWYIAGSSDEQQMFMIFFALNALHLIVLLVPYRRLARWSWWAAWVGILPFALVIAFGPPNAIGWLYLGFAAFFAVCQFLALPRFLVKR